MKYLVGSLSLVHDTGLASTKEEETERYLAPIGPSDRWVLRGSRDWVIGWELFNRVLCRLYLCILILHIPGGRCILFCVRFVPARTVVFGLLCLIELPGLGNDGLVMYFTLP